MVSVIVLARPEDLSDGACVRFMSTMVMDGEQAVPESAQPLAALTQTLPAPHVQQQNRSLKLCFRHDRMCWQKISLINVCSCVNVENV